MDTEIDSSSTGSGAEVAADSGVDVGLGVAVGGEAAVAVSDGELVGVSVGVGVLIVLSLIVGKVPSSQADSVARTSTVARVLQAIRRMGAGTTSGPRRRTWLQQHPYDWG